MIIRIVNFGTQNFQKNLQLLKSVGGVMFKIKSQTIVYCAIFYSKIIGKLIRQSSMPPSNASTVD